MPALRLTRRVALLLPFALAACEEAPPPNFPPLTYSDYPPIRLNVASISIEQRFYPSNMAPNVNERDPADPVAALRAMAQDRLQALGAAGQAVFGITNASVTRQDDRLTCSLAVVLEIYGSPGIRSGFAEAAVTRQHTGPIDHLPQALYDLTKRAMAAMNVEFEFQVRRNLQQWLVSSVVVPPPVQAQPLAAPGAPIPGAAGAPYPGAAGAPYPGAAGAPYPGAAGAPYPGAAGAPYPGAAGAPYPGAAGAPYPGAPLGVPPPNTPPPPAMPSATMAPPPRY
jgi:hypothetical protein